MTKKEKVCALLVLYNPFLSLYFQKNPLPKDVDTSSLKNLLESLKDFKPQWNDHTEKCLQFLNLTGDLSLSQSTLRHFFPDKTVSATTPKKLFSKFLDFYILLELENLKMTREHVDEIKEWVATVKEMESDTIVFQIFRLSYNLAEDPFELISNEIMKDTELVARLEAISNASNKFITS